MVEQDGRLSAQVAVLGSLLIDPSLVGQALEKIRPEDFLTPKCRMVFQAIKSLYTEGRPTDPVTVRGRLEAVRRAFGDRVRGTESGGAARGRQGSVRECQAVRACHGPGKQGRKGAEHSGAVQHQDAGQPHQG